MIFASENWKHFSSVLMQSTHQSAVTQESLNHHEHYIEFLVVRLGYKPDGELDDQLFAFPHDNHIQLHPVST